MQSRSSPRGKTSDQPSDGGESIFEPADTWEPGMAEELTFKDEAAALYDEAFAHVTAYFMPFLLQAAGVAPGMRYCDRNRTVSRSGPRRGWPDRSRQRC